jgi:hypothetical protein
MAIVQRTMFSPRQSEPSSVRALRACAHMLPERDRAIAESLLGQAARELSPKQSALVVSLIDRAHAPPAQTTDGLDSIVAMLTGASAHLKWPVIRFEAGGVCYRLGRSGPASREPGSVNVTTDEKAFDQRTYFGRINLLGVFEPRHGQAECATAIGAALRAFAAAPAEQSRTYGQRFGRCCYCGLELTDGRSITAGYGPICADHYGLPWG